MALVQIPTPTSAQNWTLVNTGGTTLTGADTITVSGISGVNKIMVLVEDASSANAAAYIRVRFNADAGNNYQTFGAYMEQSSTYATTSLGNQDGALAGVFIGRMSNNASSQVSGYLLATGCNGSSVKMFESGGSGNAGGGSAHTFFMLPGYYNSTSPITSVSLNSSTGNFDGGILYVYTSVN